jgi:hypothetical protein
LIRRLFPKDEQLGEIALRLADFALRGQHPSGLFYETFDTRIGEWLGVRGIGKRPLVSLAQSARIAERVIALASDLASRSLPFEKYWLAGLRFVELFLDGKGRLIMPGSLYAPGESVLPAGTGGEAWDADLEGFDFLLPLARVHKRTGRDKFRKAIDLMVGRFSSLPWEISHLPTSRAGREPDSLAAMRCARVFIEMRRLGYRPVDSPTGNSSGPRARRGHEARGAHGARGGPVRLTNDSPLLFASLVLPWIRVHPAGGEKLTAGTFDAAGGIVDSFLRQRILFAGYETAWLLLSLARLSSEPWIRRVLKCMADLCIECAGRAPMGSGFYLHTRWAPNGNSGKENLLLGPVDSRRLAREAEFAMRIMDEFPRKSA